MISLLKHLEQDCNKRLILLHLVFIVWKQFVHLVVLSLHGQSLPKLNHPHIFWTFWIEFIQTQTQGQIMFALIKHVLSFVMLLQVDGGIFGGIQHDLLLIHTIISTIEQQIIFVASTAILHH